MSGGERPVTGWRPLGTRLQTELDLGRLVAVNHAVWRITGIWDLPLSEDDREVWSKSGMPEPRTWRERPRRYQMQWLGGAEPEWATDHDPSTTKARFDVAAGTYPMWHTYEGERWPQCSCCGEPMPCRAELEEREVNAILERVARLEKIPPGACWACAEPVTSRQDAVNYPGDNLDLPGAHAPTFHTRDKCLRMASAYELRWIAVDPRRERILTWPVCEGILLVHADGSSECRSGRGAFGEERESQPGCQGHLTHDHGTVQSCVVGDDWLSPDAYAGKQCPRGCRGDTHPGIQLSPRPKRRAPSDGGLF